MLFPNGRENQIKLLYLILPPYLFNPQKKEKTKVQRNALCVFVCLKTIEWN